MSFQDIKHDSVNAIIENIANAERKLALMKQYVNPQTGTIDYQIVSNLVKGTEDNVAIIGDLLHNFS